MTSKDENEDTRAMYFDLLPIYVKQQREIAAQNEKKD